jgi:hypothetical protein
MSAFFFCLYLSVFTVLYYTLYLCIVPVLSRTKKVPNIESISFMTIKVTVLKTTTNLDNR